MAGFLVLEKQSYVTLSMVLVQRIAVTSKKTA
jgi:hypothetical protein